MQQLLSPWQEIRDRMLGPACRAVSSSTQTLLLKFGLEEHHALTASRHLPTRRSLHLWRKRTHLSFTITDLLVGFRMQISTVQMSSSHTSLRQQWKYASDPVPVMVALGANTHFIRFSICSISPSTHLILACIQSSLLAAMWSVLLRTPAAPVGSSEHM